MERTKSSVEGMVEKDPHGTSPKKTYIICAPAYCGSAGVRVLYDLRQQLEEHGYNAYIFCCTKDKQPKDYDPVTIKKITPHNREHDIVVYPEIIQGNPLLFRNVVRFCLNKPGVLGGDSSFHPSEMVFSYDDYCIPNIPHVRLDMLDRKLFINTHQKREFNCYFVHKGGKWREVPELKGCIEINSSWPKTRAELARLLQQTHILYSYDENSCLLQEATLCGVQVKIITPHTIEDYKFKDEFDPNTLNQQLDYFIKTTQAMQYSGKINRKGYYPLSAYISFFLRRKLLQMAYLVTQLQSFKEKIKQLKKKAPFIWGGGYVL